DIAYADGYIADWDQFLQQVEPITSTIPYMVASGNHERDWPDSGSFYTGTDSEPMGRDDMQKLWQKYRVDTAFYGHVHDYERTCPIYQVWIESLCNS
ncbi:putative inactive purple acid phosphatase 27, partial [Quercus suber]